MKKLTVICVLLICLVLLSACVSEIKSPPDDTPSAVPETQLPVAFPEPPNGLKEALESAVVHTQGDEPLRKFPYPYKAMLAITSDCDSTTVETFERMHRFLNTYEETQYGRGLGLDISDSFFVYNGSDYDTADNLMSYCEGIDPSTLKDAELIKRYYDCGWIDSIHALGDFSSSVGSYFNRSLAESAWALLDKAGISPTIWIDHGTYTNVQNFGAYNPNNASSYQMGDNPASPYYHTDLTLAHSIRYTWYSRHSDVFGQDYPLETRELRDGNTVWSFQRYSCEFIGTDIDFNWRPNRIHEQITSDRLDSIVRNGQYSLVAQHLTVFQEDEQMGEADIAALQLLAKHFHEDKDILVTRTSRLLDYAQMWRYLNFQVAEKDGFTLIRILSINDPVRGERVPGLEDLRGLTFYCGDATKTAVYIGDTLLNQSDFSLNPADETGRQSISVLWFKPDTNDYATAK